MPAGNKDTLRRLLWCGAAIAAMCLIAVGGLMLWRRVTGETVTGALAGSHPGQSRFDADEDSAAPLAPDKLSSQRKLSKPNAERGITSQIGAISAEEAQLQQEQLAKAIHVPREVVNSIGMKLVLIPPGEFRMGSPASDEDREKDECQAQVRITKPFYLGMHEVTQAQYERVMGSNPRHRGAPSRGEDWPVVNVSWDEAVAFCRELMELPREKDARRVYRLPTEAEWEYACRAGTTTRFCFGDNAAKLGEYAWFDGNSDGQSHPVGQKKPNAWGLCDMHGNVFEWCHDWYSSDYARLPADDPQGPSSGAERVVRGGCAYEGGAKCCRSAYRRRLKESVQGERFLGFRVAFVPPGQ
jgi:formylglycine-generating enzyme required for sulfatase activity